MTDKVKKVYGTYKVTGFDCYFTEGFSEKFEKQFRRLVCSLYRKYCYAIGIEEFYDFCRDKFRKRMVEVPVFDKSLTPSFATYLHSIIRNEATRVNSKYGRVSAYEDVRGDYNLQRSEDDSVLGFFTSLKCLGIDNIDFDRLKHNILSRDSTYLTFAYYWLLFSGRIVK